MGLKIPVAHDFVCPWCWVATLQVKRLQDDFGAEIEWIGYELLPRGLEWPKREPAPEPPANKPPLLSRFQFLLAADGVELPEVEKPKGMYSHNAHEAAEYAKTEGVGNELVDALYEAYWERGEDISDIDVILRNSEMIVSDLRALAEAIKTERFKDKITLFNESAYEKGIYNVPTFIIGGKRFAEMPYSVLKKGVIEAQSRELLSLMDSLD